MTAFKLSDADAHLCRSAIRHGSKSFNAASLLLPARVRLPARALYAFCRAGDDLIDREGATLASVDMLIGRLDAIYQGRPHDLACDRAFAAVAETYAIPKTVPLAMVEGFEWDLTGRRYRTEGELLEYCARVAGTVGIMMTLIMGVRDRNVLARAAELGLAMQLTNIARDVGEDAMAGRVYLPETWLADAGLTPQLLLADPRWTPELGTVVERLLAAADRLYESSLSGIGGLPWNCRAAIHAAAGIYRRIGDRVAMNGYDSMSRRAVTSHSTKLAASMRAVAGFGTWSTPSSDAPPEQVAFLIDACALAQETATAATRETRQASDFERVLDLIQRLSDREAAAGTPLPDKAGI